MFIQIIVFTTSYITVKEGVLLAFYVNVFLPLFMHVIFLDIFRVDFCPAGINFVTSYPLHSSIFGIGLLHVSVIFV